MSRNNGDKDIAFPNKMAIHESFQKTNQSLCEGYSNINSMSDISSLKGILINILYSNNFKL